MFSPAFTVRPIATNGATLSVRVAGRGPAVVMLHGFGETGDTWARLANQLADRHTVIVPDLRGMGLSSRTEGGFTKSNQAEDIAGVLRVLQIAAADFVAHDIGNMIAYAFAARHPGQVGRVVLMDAPIPGLGDWDTYAMGQRVWHWRFYGADVERLVAGRERIYLDRFWNELSFTPASIGEALRQHYAALYAQPGAMHSAFSQFAAFADDVAENRDRFRRIGKLDVPVLAIGGDHSYGARMKDVAEAAFRTVRTIVIARAGHWLMEEQPAAVIRAVEDFLHPAR